MKNLIALKNNKFISQVPSSRGHRSLTQSSYA